MSTLLGSIIRRATREPGARLNVLTFPTHEAAQTCWTTCNADYWLFQDGKHIKPWQNSYRRLPKNHHLLPPAGEQIRLPADIDFDLVLSQNKFGQFQVAHQIARTFQIPLVSLEHTLPPPYAEPDYVPSMKALRGDINVFISEFSRAAWGWDESEASVVHHGIDTNLFKPGRKDRQERILSCVNDWANRDWCCGFKIWQRVAKDLPTHVVGDNPGLSEVAKSTFHLVQAYQDSRIFLNTSTVSPVPTALMEAMAAGCAVVTTATCMIPTIIDHGVNGFMSNDEGELRQYLKTLLDNPELCKKLGEGARQTILERFPLSKHVATWDALMERAVS